MCFFESEMDFFKLLSEERERLRGGGGSVKKEKKRVEEEVVERDVAELAETFLDVKRTQGLVKGGNENDLM